MENTFVRALARRDQCCLCGKTKDQVRKLIVGLHGAVCSDCIDLCNDILHNPGRPKEIEAGWDGTVKVKGADRDVFPDALQAEMALSAMADLIRGFVSTSEEGSES